MHDEPGLHRSEVRALEASLPCSALPDYLLVHIERADLPGVTGTPVVVASTEQASIRLTADDVREYLLLLLAAADAIRRDECTATSVDQRAS